MAITHQNGRRGFMVADILSNCVKESENLAEKDEPPNSPEARKIRTTFSSDQILTLEKQFNRQRYLSAVDRLELAKRLKLSDNQVKTWYQNRRMKLKRQMKLQMQRYHENLYCQSLYSCLKRNRGEQYHEKIEDYGTNRRHLPWYGEKYNYNKSHAEHYRFNTDNTYRHSNHPVFVAEPPKSPCFCNKCWTNGCV